MCVCVYIHLVYISMFMSVCVVLCIYVCDYMDVVPAECVCPGPPALSGSCLCGLCGGLGAGCRPVSLRESQSESPCPKTQVSRLLPLPRGSSAPPPSTSCSPGVCWNNVEGVEWGA